MAEANVEAHIRENYYIDLDDDDLLEFQYAMPLKVDTIRVPDVYEWKGAHWTATLRLDTHGALRGFAAITDGLRLPDDYILNVQYDFTLVPVTELPESYRVPQTAVDVYAFKKPSTGFEDRGLGHICTVDDLKHIRQFFVTDDNCVIIKCRMKALPFLFYKPISGFSSRAAVGMVGLENLGATCYLNALLQMLFHVNEFRQGVYSIPFQEEVFSESTTLAMQSVFSKLQLSDVAVTTTDLTRAFGWDSFEAFQQQDVQEMLRVLLDKLEERMRDTPVHGLIKRLFAGKVRSYIRCLHIPYESAREEEFYDVQLDVKGCRNVYDSFRKYIEKEILNGDNKYDAGEDRGKQDAEKGVIFTELPPVLTIHLKRFEFDMQRMGFAKIHDRYEFPVVLDLNDFVSPPAAASGASEQEGKGETADEANKSEQPVNNVYRLHSVLVHSGEVYGGHYYAYIRPSGHGFWECKGSTTSNGAVDMSPNQGRWYKFDDEDVFPANRREAVDMCYGDRRMSRGLSSAYMLVYIRETEASEVMANVDIPADLIARLEQERIKADLDNKLRSHVSNLRQMYYFLEDDVALFNQYTQKEDFVAQGAIRVLHCAKGCHFVGLQFALAAELKVLPHQIEIWSTIFGEQQKLRVYDKMGPRAIVKSLDFPYFVRVLVHDDLSDELRETYTRLQQEEATFLDAVRVALTPPGVELPYDPCEGCGIGRGMVTIKKMDDSKRDSFLQKYTLLLEESSRIISENMSTVPTTHQLVFFKVFDAENKLPHPCFAGSTRADVADPEAHDKCPLVYIGSDYVDESDTVQDIGIGVMRMLSGYFGILGQGIPEKWVNIHLFLMTSDGKVSRISHNGDRRKEDIEDGDIICCVPGPRVENQELLQEQETECLNMLYSFIACEINKKTFRVCPCSYIPSQRKYFKRACGLWTLSGCELSVVPPSSDDDEEVCVLSLAQSCEVAVQEVASIFRNDDNRMVVGKEYLNQDHNMFLPLLPHRERTLMKYLHPFFKGMNSHELYSLQVACLPMDKCVTSSSKRYLEFILVDQRMRDQRREWLENDIYKQAAHLYKLQRKDIMSMMTDEQGSAVDIWQLRPVHRDISWPCGVTPVADEFVSESHVYLSFDADSGLTVHDIIQDVRSNIVLSGFSPDDMATESTEEELGCGKRSIGEVVSDDAERSVRSRSGGDMLTSLGGDEVPQNGSTSCACVWSGLISPAENLRADNAGPLVLAFAIMDNHIYGYLHADLGISSIRRNWMDYLLFDTMWTRLNTIGVQYISREDWSFICGQNKEGVRSMPVEVHDFELYMQIARPVASPSGPCVTYVREDDTAQSLIERISIVTGESDWDTIRVAVVCSKRRPHYLSRVAETDADQGTERGVSPCQAAPKAVDERRLSPPESDSTADTSQSAQNTQVWDTFARFYPAFSGDEEWDSHAGGLPKLGLQRPSVRTSGLSETANSSRGRRAALGGIKIRG